VSMSVTANSYYHVIARRDAPRGAYYNRGCFTTSAVGAAAR